MDQCHGADVVRRRRAVDEGRRRGSTPSSSTRATTSPWRCSSPTASPSCWPTGGRRRRRGPRGPARDGGRRRRARGRRPRRPGARRRARRRRRAVGLRPVLRGAGGDARRGRRGQPAERRRCPGPGPRPSTSPPASSTSSRRRGVRCTWVPGCTRESARAVLLPPRRLHRSVRGGRPAAARERRRDRRARRDEIAARPRRRPRPDRDRRAPRRGRDPARSTLVVVTKFFPVSDIELLAELGVRRRRGEPRPGGARRSWPTRCPTAPALTRPLHRPAADQQGRARSSPTPTSSIGRPRARLVTALDRAAASTRAGARASSSRSASTTPRAGAAPHRRRGRRARRHGRRGRRRSSSRRHGGGPAGGRPRTRPSPGCGRWRRAYGPTIPSATWVSAGMSGDLEAAIRHGATHLRVGSAILGSRPPLRLTSLARRTDDRT